MFYILTPESLKTKVSFLSSGSLSNVNGIMQNTVKNVIMVRMTVILGF